MTLIFYISIFIQPILPKVCIKIDFYYTLNFTRSDGPPLSKKYPFQVPTNFFDLPQDYLTVGPVVGGMGPRGVVKTSMMIYGQCRLYGQNSRNHDFLDIGGSKKFFSKFIDISVPRPQLTVFPPFWVQSFF